MWFELFICIIYLKFTQIDPHECTHREYSATGVCSYHNVFIWNQCICAHKPHIPLDAKQIYSHSSIILLTFAKFKATFDTDLPIAFEQIN